MKFTKYCVSANGTHLQGEVYTTYEELCEVFGEPTSQDDGMDKVTCEWVLRFEDDTVATIYDWKQSATPMGLYHWHVGGFNKKALENVYNTIKGR